MTKRHNFLLLGFCIVIFSVSAFAGTPKIEGVAFHAGVLAVSFDTGGEDLWIGASWRGSNGRIHDLSPRRVSSSDSRYSWTIMSLIGLINNENEARVSLWESKDGSSMRGRVADTGWFSMARGF